MSSTSSASRPAHRFDLGSLLLSLALPALLVFFTLLTLTMIFVLAVQAAPKRYHDEDLAGQAGRYNALLQQQHRRISADAQSLITRGDRLTASGDRRAAAKAYGAAYVVDGSVKGLLRLSRTLLDTKSANYAERTELPQKAARAAYLAYQKALGEAVRAHALSLLAEAFERRSRWRDSLRVLRFSLGHVERDMVRARYDVLYKKHGFRLLDYKVDSDSASPRLCLNFSEKLKTGAAFDQYVRITGHDQIALSASNQQLCVEGLEHGKRYQLSLRAGLPAAIDDKLAKSSRLNVYIKDRSPMVRLDVGRYVLPATGETAGLPVTSVNTDKAHIEIYRVNDRSLGAAVQGEFLKQLAGYNISELKERLGARVWKGVLDIEQQLNKDVVTRFPVQDAVPALKPGVYVMVADANNRKEDDWQQKATQWFIISDLGLAGLSGADGVHAFVRSLKSAAPKAGVNVRLIAKNNEILGRKTTDGGGFVSFPASLARGEGGQAPALLVAQTKSGDYAFLDLTRTAFDLSDRGVTGRAPAGPIDVYLFAERGVYKPGEAVHVTGLARDNQAKALNNLPLTFKFMRPDGIEHLSRLVKDQGLGGRSFTLNLPQSVKTGTWRVLAYTDVKKEPLGETSFLVEDFVPERLDLVLTPASKQISADSPLKIALDGKYLYGAPARDLAIEATITIKPETGELSGFPKYRFGLAGEKMKPVRRTYAELPRTDGKGRADLLAALPLLPETSKPLKAEMTVRLRESSGRSIERRVTLPVKARTPLIGIRPLFDDLQENARAEFDIAVRGINGKRRAYKDLSWDLVELNTRYQWYRTDGRWHHEKITSEKRLAGGRIDARADAPVRISAPVGWGRFRLEVRDGKTGRPASSHTFEAGWYASASTDTPEMLDVALDKKDYRIGETAQLRIKARHKGKALITVLNGGIRAMQTIDLPKGESSVDLRVDESWGAGAYVAVNLYRPLDQTAKRLPGRTLGIAWLNAGHEQRLLKLDLQTPAKIRPDGPLDVPVTISGLAPGEEAYVVASAVDVGILNLTGYQPPAPAKHFLAQHRLGMEFRDLYGRLIDGMQGTMGRIRSGGDGPGKGKGMSLEGQPPDSKPLALFAGIVRIDDNGKANLHFDLPPFNGSVKIMAAAWSATRMGSAAKTVIVRDKVIMTGTTPRFLARGDKSQLHMVLHNVEGRAGDYTLKIASPDEITSAQTINFPLGPDQRQTLTLPLAPGRIGDAVVMARLTGPDGIDLTRKYLVPVKPAWPSVSRMSVSSLVSGAKLQLNSDVFTGFVDGTAKASVSVGPSSLPDIPGLLASLDRYPYGCSEQITSRALPLLYLSSVATQAGLDDNKKEDLKARLQKAIDTLSSRQGHNGSFGLWRTGSGGKWLTTYVTEFLTRAREQGYDVPDRVFTSALDRLSNTLSYAGDFDNGGSDVAYALYVLARNKRARLSELRYYADEKLEDFSSPLAKAQLATALALYGDKSRAEKAYLKAIGKLNESSKTPGRGYDMSNYGSTLRDGAATLALVSETGLRPTLLPAIANVLERSNDPAASRSANTQEQAWLLLAANALFEEAKTYRLDLNGETHTGPLTTSLTRASLPGPLNITNKGDATARATITVSGSPETPEPSVSNGFTIKRSYHTLAGEEVDLATVAQNTRLVVVLEVHEAEALGGQVMLNAPLPAGFEIDNPRLVSSGGTSSLGWLNASTKPVHTEFRDDRFLAAYKLSGRKASSISAAFIIRAVAPGHYVHGPASIEDMYRIERLARTNSGHVEVTHAR